MTKQEKEYIIKLLQEGKELPEDFKYLLFPTKQKEYELAYAGKMRKEDLLANEDGVFPVPLQVEKVFNGNEYEAFDDGWKNIIAFGDNLQFLKTIYENKDPLIRDKVKGKVPPKVYEEHEEFWFCSKCNKIYWIGSHWRDILYRLEKAKRLTSRRS
jgi:hypothetical protein